MYYVFQQSDEMSSVLFYESCDTEQKLDELIATAGIPIMFVYNDISKGIKIINDYYDFQQCRQIISSLLR